MYAVAWEMAKGHIKISIGFLPKLKFERNIEFSSRHKVEDRTLEWQLSY